MKKILIPMMMLALAGCASPSKEGSALNEGPAPTPVTVTTEAPPTYADPNEQAFVDALTADGLIPKYGDADSAVQFGHVICEAYGKNISTGMLAQEISRKGDMPYTAVEEFAYEATDNLCPVFRGH